MGKFDPALLYHKGTAQILVTNIISTRVHMISTIGLFLIIMGLLMVNSLPFIQSVFVFGQNPPFSPFESQRDSGL